MQSLGQKVGDSLSWLCTLKDDLTGVPVNLTGGTLKSQLRGLDGTLLATPTIVVSNQGTNPGEFSMTIVDGEVFRTAPVPLFCDIQFTLAGLITSSDTFIVDLTQDITL